MKTNHFFTFILFAFAFLLGTSVQAGRQTRKVSEFHGVSVSSGSDIELSGKASFMQVSASSGSDIDAGELVTKKCNASLQRLRYSNSGY